MPPIRFSATQDPRSVLQAWVFSLVLAAAAVGFTARAEDRTGQEAFEALSERFQGQLDALQKQYGFPGATAAFILSDGRCAGFATGYADREEAIAMTPDTRLLPASIGKTFVAAVALSLLQEGKLGLDDKIEGWLGEESWFERLPNHRDITLRHLLTHSGGLADHVNDLRFAFAARKWLAADPPEPDRAFTPREQIEFILDRAPLFPAGKGYAYTDTGYLIVGLIIERVSGTTYYEELQKRFLTPLKLSLTGPANRRDIPGLSSAYVAEDNLFGLPVKIVQNSVMVFSPASEWTGGGLVSNAKDLVRWGKLLYEGDALDKPYLEDLLESGFRDPSKKGGYGLGVSIDESEFGKVYGHGGWTPGYLSRLAYFADHKTAIAVQVNSDDVDEGLRADFLKLAKVLFDG